MRMFLCITLFLSFNIKTQSILIQDKDTKLPLIDVNVFSKDKGTTSDNYGVCFLDNFENEDLVNFSLVGYKSISLKKNNIPKILYLENLLIPLDLVYVYGKGKKYRKRFIRLEKNVKKVYPYARTLATLMVEYNGIIDSLDNFSGYKKFLKKRKIFKNIENELFSKYGYSIRRLTKNQGRILIRLIDREVNTTSYNIIKNFRSVFSAGFWQFTARLFGHNLKSTYNPSIGEDKLIEYILNNRIRKNFDRTR